MGLSSFRLSFVNKLATHEVCEDNGLRHLLETVCGCLEQLQTCQFLRCFQVSCPFHEVLLPKQDDKCNLIGTGNNFHIELAKDFVMQSLTVS